MPTPPDRSPRQGADEDDSLLNAALARGHSPPPPAPPPPSLEAASEPPALVADKYRLVRHLGAGGMGAVWEAEQVRNVTRTVALKLIKSPLAPGVAERFVNEAQCLADLDHPNIAKVYDVGVTDDGLPYLSMQLVAGKIHITDYCADKRLTRRARLGLFMTVCLAVQHAHTKGVIHRDIKPSNVLVRIDDGQPVPVVIDFGVATRAGEVAPDRMAGTPAYMSPEQTGYGAAAVDTRSDVYGLGVLLYELLTGTVPLDKNRLPDSERLMKTAGRAELFGVITSLREPPSTRATADPTHTRAKWTRRERVELDAIVAKALALSPDARYQSAGDLAADVNRHLKDEVVCAVGPRRGYWTAKALRRNRGLAVVPLVFLAGLLGTTLGFVRAERKADEFLELNGVLYEQNGKLQNTTAALTESKTQLAERTTQLTDQLTETRKQLDRSRVVEANSAMADGPAGEAVARLNEVAPENRGWVWRLLRHQAGGAYQYAMTGHAGHVIALGASADGSRVVSVGADCTIRTWDARDGTELSRAYTGWEPFQAAAVCPDGARVVAADRDGTIRAWDLEAGRVTITYTPPLGEVHSLAVSPDGARVGAAVEGLVLVWEAATGHRVACIRVPEGPKNQPFVIALSAGGHRAVTRSVDALRIWDVATGQTWREFARVGTLDGRDGLAVSADGSTVATANWFAGSVDIWDAERPDRVRTLRANGEPFIRSVTLSPDGTRVAACQHKMGAYVWDVRTGRQVLHLDTDQDDYHHIVYAPGADRFFVTREGGSILSIDARLGVPLVDAPMAPPGCVTLSGNGARVLACDVEGTLSIWDVRSREKLKDIARGETVTALGTNRDGSRAITASDAPTRVTVWDVASGTRIRTFPVQHTAALAVQFSPNGQWLVSRDDHVVRIYSTETGRVTVEHANESGRGECAIAFAADDSAVVLVSDAICLYDLPTGVCSKRHRLLPGVNVHQFDPAGQTGMPCAWLSPGGRHLVFQDRNAHQLVVCDLRTGTAVAQPRSLWTVSVESGTFVPGGAEFAALFSDGTLRVLDLLTSHELVRVRTAPGRRERWLSHIVATEQGIVVVTQTGVVFEHDARPEVHGAGSPVALARRVMLAPDGRCVAETTDGRVRLYDQRTGTWYADLSPLVPTIHRAAFAASAARLVTVTGGGGVEVFDTTTGHRVTALVSPTGDPERDDRTQAGISPDGAIVFINAGKTLTAYDVTSGRPLWKYTAEKVWSGPLVVTHDGVLVLPGLGRRPARAFDACTGAALDVAPPTDVRRTGLSADGRFAVAGSKSHLIVQGALSGISESERVRRWAVTRPSWAWHEQQSRGFRDAGDNFAASHHDSYQHHARGIDALERGDLDRARFHFLTAAALRPSSPTALEPAPPPRPVNWGP